jgi:hypothetical protein
MGAFADVVSTTGCWTEVIGAFASAAEHELTMIAVRIVAVTARILTARTDVPVVLTREIVIGLFELEWLTTPGMPGNARTKVRKSTE